MAILLIGPCFLHCNALFFLPEAMKKRLCNSKRISTPIKKCNGQVFNWKIVELIPKLQSSDKNIQ